MRELNQPTAERSRGDALAGSPHTRLVDQIRPPTEDHDPARAATLCASVCRQNLLDFAPVFLLLPTAERQRLQALLAYSITLLDFSRQPGLEGERLAGLNRWEFELEQALDGHPVGQPIFVRLALEEQVRPWRRDDFDRLHRHARSIAMTGLDLSGGRAQRAIAEIAEAWLGLALGADPERQLVEQAAAVLHLHVLLNRIADGGRGALDALTRLRKLSPILIETLRLPVEMRQLVGRFDHAASYLRLIALALVRKSEAQIDPTNGSRPTVGIAGRLTTLARARWWPGRSSQTKADRRRSSKQP